MKIPYKIENGISLVASYLGLGLTTTLLALLKSIRTIVTFSRHNELISFIVLTPIVILPMIGLFPNVTKSTAYTVTNNSNNFPAINSLYSTTNRQQTGLYILDNFESGLTINSSMLTVAQKTLTRKSIFLGKMDTGLALTSSLLRSVELNKTASLFDDFNYSVLVTHNIVNDLNEQLVKYDLNNQNTPSNEIVPNNSCPSKGFYICCIVWTLSTTLLVWMVLMKIMPKNQQISDHVLAGIETNQVQISTNNHNEIIKAIEKSNIEIALLKIEKQVAFHNKSLKKQISFLRFRLRDLERQENMQLVSYDDLTRQKGIIALSTLNLLDYFDIVDINNNSLSLYAA